MRWKSRKALVQRLAANPNARGECTKERTGTESNARNTVANGANPCKLWLIDGEMWARGTLDALLVQDLHARRWGKRLDLYRPEFANGFRHQPCSKAQGERAHLFTTAFLNRTWLRTTKGHSTPNAETPDCKAYRDWV